MDAKQYQLGNVACARPNNSVMIQIFVDECILASVIQPILAIAVGRICSDAGW